MAQLRFPQSLPRPEVQYVRAPEPIDFPEEASVPESKTHLVLRTFLFRLLSFALGPAHRVGSEQFLYWNASDKERCLAPDAVVRLNVPDAQFKTWKTWEEGGVPDLAVEVVSDSDRRQWSEKLSDYHELGVKELVRFDPAQPEGARLRVWDRLDEDLVERAIAGDETPCLTLGVSWVVRPIGHEPVGLRLIDGEGRLLEVPEEAEAKARAAAERARDVEAKARAAAERARDVEAKAREAAERARDVEAKDHAAAEARVRELEEELRRTRGGGSAQ